MATTTLTADETTLANQFKSLRTLADIAKLLEVDRRTLGFYLHRANNYKVFKIFKQSGGERIIATPVSPLKIIQRKLNQVLHAVYGGRSPVHGFTRNKSIVTNARMHLDRDFVLNFDLEDFFPSLHFGRVKGLFEGKPHLLPEQAAVTLAQICCFDGALPVGAPTSPVVANMVCAQLDAQLKRLAVDYGCTYTRYADDITFSTMHGRFPSAIAYRDQATRKWAVGDEIVKIVSGNIFKINNSKTRVLPRGSRQEVTGLIVGSRVNVKRTFVRHVRAILHAAEKWGITAAAQHFNLKYDRKQRLKRGVDFLRVLRGKIEFVGSVRGRDDFIYLHLLDRYLKLDPKARSKPINITPYANDRVFERAIWLVEEKDGPTQGTAFAAENAGLITAAHVVESPCEARQPRISPKRYAITVSEKNTDYDVASLSIAGKLKVQFKIGSSNGCEPGSEIKLLGFPRYHEGDGVSLKRPVVVQKKVIHGVAHYVIEPSIIVGNSGGPVLGKENEVIGVAVKGQGEPGNFTSQDEVSCFVPIEAIKHLSSR